MAQNIPLAWKQLTFERMKLSTAIAGVMVAVMLMWIQLGILATIYNSATEVHRNVKADLVVMHPLSENLTKMKPFSTRTLFRLRGHPDVTEVGELFVAPVEWRNPQTGEMKSIVVYGFDVDAVWLGLPGVREHAAELRMADTFLFDRNSKDVFGPVKPWLAEGKVFEVELSHRRCRPVGLTAVAASFGQEGSIITNRANFLRLHAEFSPNELHVGLVRLRPGADVKSAQEYFREELKGQAVVLTPKEFTEFELRFWKTNAPVGFIFTMGAAVGFFIGFIVVYQIL